MAMPPVVSNIWHEIWVLSVVVDIWHKIWMSSKVVNIWCDIWISPIVVKYLTCTVINTVTTASELDLRVSAVSLTSCSSCVCGGGWNGRMPMTSTPEGRQFESIYYIWICIPLNTSQGRAWNVTEKSIVVKNTNKTVLIFIFMS